jgi:ABC-type transport system involved in cytochrome bd biosynthesis fused ATPase/permease subunit
MKFKYNIFNFITAIAFVLAFLCLMFSYATQIMFYPSMVFFEVGFVMLSVKLIQNYLAKQNELSQQQETIVMELLSGEDGETYVMQDEKKDKKARRKKRAQKFDRLFPSIFSILAAALILYMLISSIVRAF